MESNLWTGIADAWHDVDDAELKGIVEDDDEDCEQYEAEELEDV